MNIIALWFDLCMYKSINFGIGGTHHCKVVAKRSISHFNQEKQDLISNQIRMLELSQVKYVNTIFRSNISVSFIHGGYLLILGFRDRRDNSWLRKPRKFGKDPNSCFFRKERDINDSLVLYKGYKEPFSFPDNPFEMMGADYM